MSRFEQLCETLRQTRRQYYAYREECSAFMSTFMMGLREYLDVPDGYCEYYATQGHWKGRKVPGLTAAMHLDDDSYFHIGVVIDLVEKPDTFPTEPNGFILKLKKRDNAFEVILPDDKQFVIDAVSEEAFEPVYEHMFNIMRKRYDNALREFLDTADVKRRQGF